MTVKDLKWWLRACFSSPRILLLDAMHIADRIGSVGHLLVFVLAFPLLVTVGLPAVLICRAVMIWRIRQLHQLHARRRAERVPGG